MHKIIFIGTNQFAVPILEALVACPLYSVFCTITAPDKPSGRKQRLTSSPVKQTTLKYRLPLLQPEKVSNIKADLGKIQPDLIVLAAYGQIINSEILKLPRFGCLNIHPSLLPQYRGPSPIQTAILNGERTTGISLILMDEKIDHGPLINQKKVKIAHNDTYQSLEQKLAQRGARLLIQTLPDYIKGKIKPKKQKHKQASYTKILNRQDGKIDWSKSAQDIERKVRAFYPWPGTWTYLAGQRVKIIKAKALNKKQKTTLPAGQGFLQLDVVQPAGKKPMTGEEYFRGHPNN